MAILRMHLGQLQCLEEVSERSLRFSLLRENHTKHGAVDSALIYIKC